MDIEYQILIILFIHWVADFLLQTSKMATNKSTSNKWLFFHVFDYSIVWLFIGIFFFNYKDVILFSTITFICHFITDYFTSRWTTKLYKVQNFRKFFKVIGFDQYLHFIQLILTYKFLK